MSLLKIKLEVELWVLFHFKHFQILYVNTHNFINKYISLNLHLKQIIVFDWL